MTVLFDCWFGIMLVFSVLGIGAVYNTIYMKYIYIEPEIPEQVDEHKLRNELLRERLDDVLKANERLMKENEELTKALLTRLTA